MDARARIADGTADAPYALREPVTGIVRGPDRRSNQMRGLLMVLILAAIVLTAATARAQSLSTTGEGTIA